VRFPNQDSIWLDARIVRFTRVSRNNRAEKPPGTQQSCAATAGAGGERPLGHKYNFSSFLISSIFLTVVFF
jgi:hypothetical protein